MGKMWKQYQISFSWAPKSLQMVTIDMTLAPWKKSYDNLTQHIKKQRCHFAEKGPSSQSCGFSSGHVWMWELNHKEGWALKNWCFQSWCWRRLLRVPWTARWSNPVNPKRKSESHSVVFDSLWPHRLYSPWNFPGQNTGVGSLSLLLGIFPTQGSNPDLPHCR